MICELFVHGSFLTGVCMFLDFACWSEHAPFSDYMAYDFVEIFL